MLVSDIAIRVKRGFGDEAGSQITDADIIRWINDAQREISTQKMLFQSASALNLVSGQATYPLPGSAAAMTVRTINFNVPGGAVLQKIPFADGPLLASLVPPGVPHYYYIWNNMLTVFPVPNASFTLQLFVTRPPNDVALVTDTPEIPLQYHPRLVSYCKARAYELDDNIQAMQLADQDFVSGLANTEDMTTTPSKPVRPNPSKDT